MNLWKQILAVVDLNLRNLPQRLGASLVIVIGIAGVVGVLISVLAIATGFSEAMAGAGSPDRALILSSGALSEALSSIPQDAVPSILELRGIAKDRENRPIAQPETLAQVQVSARDGKLVNLPLRGLDRSTAFTLHPEIHLIAGRLFTPGVHELIVGRIAQARYGGLQIGTHLSFQNGDWVIVGTFATTQPSLVESELLTDGPTLLSAYQRNWFQSITVRLAGPEALAQLQQGIKADPTLRVYAVRESAYTATQAKGTNTVLSAVGYFIGGIMALGALFGAVNTLYAAVSARSREIAQLRAIGFGATPVVISVLTEGLLLSVAGALLGAAIAWLLFNGHVTGIANAAFTMDVTPALIALGIIWGCVIGLAGGLFPAINAGRLPVARALGALA